MRVILLHMHTDTNVIIFCKYYCCCCCTSRFLMIPIVGRIAYVLHVSWYCAETSALNVSCSVLLLQCAAACCRVMQCAAVCCSWRRMPLMMVFSVTGWRRPIGCLKLQVIFRKIPTNYTGFLRKMTYKDKASYGCLPPCNDGIHS